MKGGIPRLTLPGGTLTPFKRRCGKPTCRCTAGGRTLGPSVLHGAASAFGRSGRTSVLPAGGDSSYLGTPPAVRSRSVLTDEDPGSSLSVASRGT